MGAWGERNQNFSSKSHKAMTSSCMRQPLSRAREVPYYPLPCMPSPPPIFINLSDIPPPPPARALYTMEDILIDIMDYRPSPKKEKSKSDDDDDDDDVTALNGAPVTPSTSASSSPSLPSSTPPPTPPPPVAMAAAIARRGSIRFGGMMGRRLASSVPAEEEDDEEEGASPLTSPSSSSSGWRIPASRKSMRTRNPIRAIVDPIMAAEMARGGDDDEYPTTTARKDQISLAVSGCISPYQSLSTYIASVGRCHHPSIHPSIHPPSLVAPVSYTLSCLRRTHTHICIYTYLR